MGKSKVAIVLAFSLLLATATVPVLGGAPASASRHQTSLAKLTDGRWAGTLHWTGTQRGELAGSGLQVRAAPFSGSGSMQFVVQGDQIRESSYSMVISGSVIAIGPDDTLYTGDRTMTYSGAVAGFPEGPCLEG